MAGIGSTAIVGGTVLLSALVVFFSWLAWMSRSRRPRENGYQYVMVTKDGSAREVTPAEREYLETEFDPADGARPYIKFRYESVDGWGSIEGFLLRRQLPSRIP